MENKIKPIVISRKDIENTEAFKLINVTVKKIILSKTNVLHIQHGVNVSVNTSYQNWENQTSFNSNNRKIVKELVILNK